MIISAFGEHFPWEARNEPLIDFAERVYRFADKLILVINVGIEGMDAKAKRCTIETWMEPLMLEACDEALRIVKHMYLTADWTDVSIMNNGNDGRSTQCRFIIRLRRS